MIYLMLHVVRKPIAANSNTHNLEVVGYIKKAAMNINTITSRYTDFIAIVPNKWTAEQLKGLELDHYYSRDEAYLLGLDIIGIDESWDGN